MTRPAVPPVMRGACLVSTALAVLTLASSAAIAQGGAQTGATHLRLDAVDVSRAPTSEFTFFASFLDKYSKPVSLGADSKWTISFNGEPVTGELSVKPLRESRANINLVVVLGAVVAMGEDPFKAAANGSADLVGSMREGDRSAVVAYTDVPEATDALSPAHRDALDWIKERQATGLTPALYDAIERGLELFPASFDSIGPNRAMVVITDGVDKDQESVTKLNDRINRLQTIARDRSVRISVIAVDIEALGQFERVEKLANATGATIRIARTPAEIQTNLANYKSELLGQYVLDFRTGDFEGDTDIGFKLQIEHGGQSYSSDTRIRAVPAKVSNLGLYAAIIGGSLLALVLLFFVFRALWRVLRRKPQVETVEGPDLRECEQCQNKIPINWKICQYCEALPHYGRLTVVSVQNDDSSHADEDLQGRVYFIKESQIHIGSATNNHVAMPVKGISKRHAGIQVQDGRFELADYGSLNGTFINGNRVSKQFLKDGDEISFAMVVKTEFKLKK
jgi:Mg-chelatase subunit ChlD